MCSHRLAIARLVREYKEPLFSPVSSQISRQNKQELWEHVRQQAVAQGAVQYARKSWKEIRDCVWAPIRRDTMAKLNKARTVGEDTVMFTEIDRIVLEIIGSIGEGGGEQHDDGGMGLLLGNDGNNTGGVHQLDDNDSLNINALVAELTATGDGGGTGGEFKPDTTSLSQMIGGLDQHFAAVLNGSAAGVENNPRPQQVPTSREGGEVAQQHGTTSPAQPQQNNNGNSMMSNGMNTLNMMNNTVNNCTNGTTTSGAGATGNGRIAKCSGSVGGAGESKAVKRRAVDELLLSATAASCSSPLMFNNNVPSAPPPCVSPFVKSNSSTAAMADVELERATKQARLGQIRLQNMLIQKNVKRRPKTATNAKKPANTGGIKKIKTNNVLQTLGTGAKVVGTAALVVQGMVTVDKVYDVYQKHGGTGAFAEFSAIFAEGVADGVATTLLAAIPAGLVAATTAATAVPAAVAIGSMVLGAAVVNFCVPEEWREWVREQGRAAGRQVARAAEAAADKIPPPMSFEEFERNMPRHVRW